MTIICHVCGYDKNPDGSEFCDACGAELLTLTPTPPPPPREEPPPPTIVEPVAEEPPPPTIVEPVADTIPPPEMVKPAKLVAKQPNAPVTEFPLSGNVVIGIFDPDMGPVDIDLEKFLGSDTVSRNHAEIYPEAETWKIKDLGSTNGIFIKPAGHSRFGSRITAPTTLNSGDEIAIAKVIFLFQTT